MASDLTLVAISAIGTLGPTLAGLAAWNSSRKNASQASVDELHGCVEGLKGEFVAHVQDDDRHFSEVRRLIHGTKGVL